MENRGLFVHADVMKILKKVPKTRDFNVHSMKIDIVGIEIGYLI
jgi:hypothetical protein